MDKNGLNLQVAKWYALKCRYRGERAVLKRLEMEKAECYLPLARIKRVWSDRVKSLETPLLGQIVLVCCNETRLRYLLSTKGVTGVLESDGVPVEIGKESVEALREFAGCADGAFLVGVEVIDDIIRVKWERRPRQVMMVDDNHWYLYIPELETTLCIEK